MPTRPALSFELTPRPAIAGRPLDARLVLDCAAETKCAGIVIELVGTYRGYEELPSERGKSQEVHFTRTHLQLAHRAPARALAPGRHAVEARFDLAPTLMPSHPSKRFPVAYALRASVDIPWWPDATLTEELVVIPPPSTITRTEPILRATHAAPTETALYIEASIGSGELCVGETVEVALSLANVAHHRIRSVDVALVTIESPVFYDRRPPKELAEHVVEACARAPADGEIVRARCSVPTWTLPDVETDYFRVSHEVRVLVRTGIAGTIALALPVAVRLADAAPAAVEPVAVGRDRLHHNWQSACDALGLADARVEPGASGALTLRFGERAVTVAEVMRDGAYALDATLTWPSLGIGLRLSPSRWVDFGGLDVDEALRERVRIEAREHEQVTALFDPELTALVLGFDALRWDDRGGTATVSGSAHALEDLRRFLATVVTLDARMRDAFTRVPPPKRLHALLPAYAAFARARQATLHPGDLSVEGLGSADVPIAVRHTLGPAPEGLEDASFVVGGPVADALIPSEVVERMGVALRRPVERSDDGSIRVRLPLTVDPEALAPVVEHVHTALAALRKSSGPYR